MGAHHGIPASHRDPHIEVRRAPSAVGRVLRGQRRKAHTGTLADHRDRNDPDRYLILAFFDSYESAMENSGLAETAAFAEKQAPLLDGPPTFFDLEVIDDRT